MVTIDCDEGTNVKRHKWSDIKGRTSPETRARIEAEGQRLPENVRPVSDGKSVILQRIKGPVDDTAE